MPPAAIPFRSSFTWASVARRPVRIGNAFRQRLPLFYTVHAHLLTHSLGNGTEQENSASFERMMSARLVRREAKEDGEGDT